MLAESPPYRNPFMDSHLAYTMMPRQRHEPGGLVQDMKKGVDLMDDALHITTCTSHLPSVVYRRYVGIAVLGRAPAGLVLAPRGIKKF